MFACSILIGTMPVLLRCCFWEVTGTMELAALTHNRDTAVPLLCRETLRWRLHPPAPTPLPPLPFISSAKPKQRKQKTLIPDQLALPLSPLPQPLSSLWHTHTHTQLQAYTFVHKNVRTHSPPQRLPHKALMNKCRSERHTSSKRNFFLIQNSWGHEAWKSSCFLLFSKNMCLWAPRGIWARGTNGFHLSCILCWQKLSWQESNKGTINHLSFQLSSWPTCVLVNLLTQKYFFFFTLLMEYNTPAF